MKRLIVHVIQNLCEGGGIESMVLDMQKFQARDEEVHIVSLEGSHQMALEQWPWLKGVSERLHFINKPPGVSLVTLVILFRLFKQLNPNVVHTHHIGPLVYGGLGARFAGIPNRVHTEHDIWHLNFRKARLIHKVLLTITRPRIAIVANYMRRYY